MSDRLLRGRRASGDSARPGRPTFRKAGPPPSAPEPASLGFRRAPLGPLVSPPLPAQRRGAGAVGGRRKRSWRVRACALGREGSAVRGGGCCAAGARAGSRGGGGGASRVLPRGTERGARLPCTRAGYVQSQCSCPPWLCTGLKLITFVSAPSLRFSFFVSLFLSFKGQMRQTHSAAKYIQCPALGVSISAPWGWRLLANGMVFLVLEEWVGSITR